MDIGPVNTGRRLIKTYEAISEDDHSENLGEFQDGQGIDRLRRLVNEVERLINQSD